MPFKPPADAPRCAVVDLGSNSVRLVVYEGALPQSGGDLQREGGAAARPRPAGDRTAERRRHGPGVHRAAPLSRRGARDGRGAVRGAGHRRGARCAQRRRTSSPDCRSRLPGVPIRVLSGLQEAEYSAMGVLCGIPTADGILADIGGGSLELVRLDHGARGVSHTLSLGAIRLAERAGGDPVRARAIAEADLATVPWLAEGANRDLYLVGGAWRALARIHMAQTGYPLQMVHHYTIGREEARDLTGVIAGAGRRALERLPGLSRRRIDDLPFAAVVLRRVLRATGVRRVVFSASGLREGWFMQRMPEAIRARGPAAGRRPRTGARGSAAIRTCRRRCSPGPIRCSPAETGEARRLREAACWMSDIGSHDHPEFRAEQAFLRVLRQPGIGLDHHARAFLALAIAMRYEVDADAALPASGAAAAGCRQHAPRGGAGRGAAACLHAVGRHAGPAGRHRAAAVGQPARSCGCEEDSGVFAGESVMRRLDRLAQAVGLEAATETAREQAA